MRYRRPPYRRPRQNLRRSTSVWRLGCPSQQRPGPYYCTPPTRRTARHSGIHSATSRLDTSPSVCASPAQPPDSSATAMCVRHALCLTIVARDAPIPAAPGVRFVTLPGLQLESSGDDDRRRLAAHLRDHPEDSHVVCGCAPCALHRNLTKAWLQALLLSPSPPWESCRNGDIIRRCSR